MGLKQKIKDNYIIEDIIPFDKDNKLPHEGYLYFFMETEDETPYSHKEAVVIYSNQEVEIANFLYLNNLLIFLVFFFKCLANL